MACSRLCSTAPAHMNSEIASLPRDAESSMQHIKLHVWRGPVSWGIGMHALHVVADILHAA